MPAPKKENEKNPSAALGMTKRERAAPFPFIPLRKPTSAPSGHLLPGEGGSMPPSRIVISSESEKSFSLAVKNRGEERDHGKHRTPCSAGCRYVKGLSRIPFHPAAGVSLRPFGPPPSRGKEGVCRLPASSFRAKARNLFRLRSGKRCEERGITGNSTLPATWGKEGVCRLPPPFFPFKYPHRMAAGAGCIFGVFGMV